MADGQMDEDRRINEEYRIWKKNTPFLYDLVMTHALEWPALTVQWLPDKLVEGRGGFSTQRLLLGTHTSGHEANYLLVVETQLPLPRPPDPRGADDDAAAPPAGSQVRVEMHKRVPHEGEVNRARYMPQQPGIVATKSVSAAVYVFDVGRRPNVPDRETDCTPDLRLRGHKKEGYGLNWSPLKPGLLASGSDDAQVCLWDIQGNVERGGADLAALTTLAGHTDVVEDVCWHPVVETTLASVSDDHSLRLWDIRQPGKAQECINAHPKEVNAVAFNPFSQYVLATGSADHTVALWDTRNLKKKLHSFVTHEDDVFNLQWAPFNETILASSSADRRVCFWDMARIGATQTPEDEQDGPPELLFIHAGHTAKVSDFSWNPNPDDEWVVASVAEDNILQVWRMAECIYVEELEGEQHDG